jgi:cobalt-zinc-cadmium efflux system outer membrane protein
MKKSLLIGLIIFLSFGSLQLVAEAPQEILVTLPELIQEALEQNLRVKAAKKEWEAALEKIPQAKAMPDPVLSYSHFGQSIETRLGPQRNKISIAQQFPFFGKLSLKEDLATQESLSLQHQYHAVRADTLVRVKDAFFSLFLLDRSMGISREEKEVFGEFSRIALKKYETGQASQQDALKAQLEITRVSEKMLTLGKLRKAVVAELNSLLNRDPDLPLGETEEYALPDMPFPLEQLYEWAREYRPELRKAQSVIQKNRVIMEKVKKDYYPDFRVMVDYIDIGAGSTTHPEDGRNAWMASIGVNIPLWRKKLHAAEAEAAIRTQASEELFKNIANETFSQISALYFEIETAKEQMALYEFSLLPQAEQALKASRIGYLAGKVDFLNLLDSERVILAIKNGYFKIQADLGKSLTRLERLVGKELFAINDFSVEEN